MIHHGDAWEWMAGLEDHSVDAVITDPPYGTTNNAWDVAPDPGRMLGEFRRLVKPGGAIVIFSQNPTAAGLINAWRGGYRYDWVWFKESGSCPLNANRRPMRAFELILLFCDRTPPYHNQGQYHAPTRSGGVPTSPNYVSRLRSTWKPVIKVQATDIDVITMPRPRDGAHPTAKPIELMRRLIRAYTGPGDTVLDPFLGGGSCGVAAVEEGREILGCERDDGYCVIARDRIAAAVRDVRTRTVLDAWTR